MRHRTDIYSQEGNGMPDIITSASNPRIRRLVELQKKAKLRRETGLFVIEGVRLCADTPAKYIKEVYVTENRMHSASEKENRILKEHPVTIVSEEVMAKAAQTTTPQGILCVAKMPVYSREKMLTWAAADPAHGSAADPAAVPAHDSAVDPAAVPAYLLPYRDAERTDHPGKRGVSHVGVRDGQICR